MKRFMLDYVSHWLLNYISTKCGVGWFTNFSGLPLNTWEYNVDRPYGWRCYLVEILAYQILKLLHLFALEYTQFLASLVTS